MTRCKKCTLCEKFIYSHEPYYRDLDARNRYFHVACLEKIGTSKTNIYGPWEKYGVELWREGKKSGAHVYGCSLEDGFFVADYVSKYHIEIQDEFENGGNIERFWAIIGDVIVNVRYYGISLYPQWEGDERSVRYYVGNRYLRNDLDYYEKGGGRGFTKWIDEQPGGDIYRALAQRLGEPEIKPPLTVNFEQEFPLYIYRFPGKK